MLDPGRYFAEAIYFLQYTLAQLMWSINRAILSIAVIAESINSWITDNVGYFVQLLINALSAPLGGMFVLALTALGFWYTLNNIVPTNRWVDPSKLFSYGLIAFFFFSSPIVVIDMMEDLRAGLNVGIDQALIDGAAGDIFDTNMDGTDTGLPSVMPDVNADGFIGSFDLVSAFMAVGNLNELDSSEFPVEFEATFFPFGDPSGIDLGDEADQELAKALASEGIERLFFSLVAIPTAIAEHFLRLSLTGVAMFLYAGVPFAMLFAFFIYTQAFLGAYLKQFINLLIETLMSVIITAIMIGLLAAASQAGIGLYIAASIIALIVLLWRIKGALKLASAAFDLFGGSMITGGAGGMALADMGKRAVTGTVGLAGAALTGGATLAAGGAVLASAAALRADGNQDGAYLGTDSAKTDGRVRQLKTIAGYALGRSATSRSLIDGTHEARMLARNFRDGEVQEHAPDTLDYLRAGSSMSGFGSSPWLAMRLSPSLREAYDQIGGSRHGSRNVAFDEDGEPVEMGNGVQRNSLPPRRRGGSSQPIGEELAEHFSDLEQALFTLTNVLTNFDISRQRLNEQGQESDEELINGPLPDWLQENSAQPSAGAPQEFRLGNTHSDGNDDEDDVQNVNVVAAAPDPSTSSTLLSRSGLALSLSKGQTVDRDGRHDKYETTDAVSVGTIRLEPYQDSRRQTIHDTLARLEAPDSPAGQAAHKTLLVYTGQRNADLIQGSVGQHSAAAVQDATVVTADLLTQYRQQGLSDADQLTAFQSGEATDAIRDVVDTPLSDDQMSAVADMVMLPQRRVTREELVTVIGHEVAAGATNEQTVLQAIGSPVGFGGQTGNIRGVMAGARRMNLAAAELGRLAELIRDGLRETAQEELVTRGHQSVQVGEFVTNMAALPGMMVMPQSTADVPSAVVPTATQPPQTQEE